MSKTETKHTPGPWMFELFTSGIRVNDDKSLDKSKAYTSGFAIEVQGRQEYVASTGRAQKCDRVLVIDPDCAAQCDPKGVYYTPEECEANARLIAAAPELLEACKAVLESLHSAMVSIGYMTSEINREPSIISARAAIAKAEGRA